MSVAAYDAIAEWYDRWLRERPIHELVVPSLFALTDDVAGRRVCDLACGQGVVARLLAQRGARVVGVDLSRRLLALARQSEVVEPRGVVYCQGDARALAIAADTFDGVLCNLALMDISDLAAVCREVRRVLRPQGWFVFSITHPCFETPGSRWVDAGAGTGHREVRDYFVEGQWYSANLDGVRGKVGAYHRTLSTYLNTLLAVGLIPEQFNEPRATGTLAARMPGYSEVPAFLVTRCRRSP